MTTYFTLYQNDTHVLIIRNIIDIDCFPECKKIRFFDMLNLATISRWQNKSLSTSQSQRIALRVGTYKLQNKAEIRQKEENKISDHTPRM